MIRLHKGLTNKKWRQYPRFQQILMIGTEFARARHLLKEKDYEHILDCYERAYELLDLTINDSDKSLQKELLRFREYFGNLYLKPTIRLNNQLYRFILTLDSQAYNSIDFKKL